MNLLDRTGCDAPEHGRRSQGEIARLSIYEDLYSYGLETRQRARYEYNPKSKTYTFSKYDLGVPNHQIIYSKWNVPPPFSQ